MAFKPNYGRDRAERRLVNSPRSLSPTAFVAVFGAIPGKTLGLTVLPTLLAAADEVIE
jgi:hypothetical protein